MKATIVADTATMRESVQLVFYFIRKDEAEEDATPGTDDYFTRAACAFFLVEITRQEEKAVFPQEAD